MCSVFTEFLTQQGDSRSLPMPSACEPRIGSGVLWRTIGGEFDELCILNTGVYTEGNDERGAAGHPIPKS